MTPMKFWMVWRNETPEIKYRHTTYLDACMEAARIARLAQGQKVYVLEALEYFQSNDLINVPL